MSAALKLPEGWTSERYNIGTVIRGPSGYVTVNFDRRMFALGHRMPGFDHDKKYTGRGWSEKLVAAAVVALTEASK